jgi:AraC family transcriptional regulator
MSQNIDRIPYTDSNWRGNVLVWDEHAIFIGSAAAASLHASPAIKICVALDGTFGLRTADDDTFINYDSAVIAPGQSHAIDGRHNKMGMLLLVPEAKLAQWIAPRYAVNGISRLPDKAIAKTRRIFAFFENRLKLEGDYADNDLENAYHKLIRVISDGTIHAIDERVLKGIELIRKRQERLDMKQLAANVALSESRFSHLFTENVGVSLRRYLLWLRLREAMQWIAAGSTLTETAYEAGFADSAHLTRTFRGMLGITPSALIKESTIIAIGD